jgi:hypothetical protein
MRIGRDPCQETYVFEREAVQRGWLTRVVRVRREPEVLVPWQIHAPVRVIRRPAPRIEMEVP